MEASVPQPTCTELLEVGCLARSAERAGSTIADVVNKNHQHVGSALRRKQRIDGRELGVRILGVVGGESNVVRVRDRENRSLSTVLGTTHVILLVFGRSGKSPVRVPPLICRPSEPVEPK